MRILVPQGIGDSVWCLLKAQDLVARVDPGPIDLRIACWRQDVCETRARDFLRRFSFVDSVEMYPMPHKNNHGPVLLPGQAADKDGIYRYIPDGPHPELKGIDYAMIPNAALERGTRLEKWLPECRTNWNVMDDFRFDDEDLAFADKFAVDHGPFVIFFMASLANNTVSGHNRNGLWSVGDWVGLGDEIHERYGAQIVVVGTTWDEDYYARCVAPRVAGSWYWHSHISKWPISRTYAVVARSRFVVSYQSGIGIVAHYLGRPTAIFWRPKGDSISSRTHITFDEGMASAWARPDDVVSGKLMPCIYGRQGPLEILKHIEDHGWWSEAPAAAGLGVEA